MVPAERGRQRDGLRGVARSPGGSPSGAGRSSAERRPDGAAPPTTGGSLGAVDLYLRQVRPLPVVTREDEQICVRTARGRFPVDRSAPAAPECGACANGRCRLLDGCLRLVVALARRHQGLGVPLEDLIQEGNLGLLKALKKYDPDRGTKFATFASSRIVQEMRRAVPRTAAPISIPYRKAEAKRFRAQARADAASRSGARRSPARRSPSSREDEMLPDIYSFDSLNAPATADGPLRSELLADPAKADAAGLLDAAECERYLAEAVSRLPERLREVVSRSFGLNRPAPESLAEIGRSMHLTRERVRQLKEKALSLLRDHPGFARRLS